MSLSTKPVLVVLGATGAGKSKLALELAVRFGGQIISADAMQMYRGLDVVTNKVTKEELAAVPHHVIDFLDPMDKCTVVQFRNKALPIIKDLLRNNVLPVICGGTNYYVESLLWKVLIDQGQEFSKRTGETGGNDDCAKKFKDDVDFDDYSVSSPELLEKLRLVDPARAAELHPNDRRKIVRSLQVFNKTGQPHSQLIAEQKSQEGAGPLGGPLRFGNCLVIWVQCEQTILDERCDKRVDKMMERGMVKELEDFHREYNSKRSEPADYTIGIFQSIGFKEFHDFLLLSDAQKATEEGERALQQGLEQLKLVTRQYSRRQLKWLKHRFLCPDRPSPKVYAVDSTDPVRWDELCYLPAVGIVEAALAGKDPQQLPLPLSDRKSFNWEEKKKVFHCDGCDKYLHGIEQYNAHMSSKKHQKHVNKVAREAKSTAAAVDGTGKKLRVLVKEYDPARRVEAMKMLKAMSGLPLSEAKMILEKGGEFGLLRYGTESLVLRELCDVGIKVEVIKGSQ